MHQEHLSWWSLTSKYTKHALLFCLWPSSFQTFEYVRHTLIYAFLPQKTSCIHRFLHSNLQKHHLYFAFHFLSTVNLIDCLFWGFYPLNTCTGPCLFFYSLLNHNCYLSGTNLTSKNINGTFFVFCLSLDIFFVPFCGIWTSKYIKHTYPVTVSTLNTRSTPYLFVYNPEKRRN